MLAFTMEKEAVMRKADMGKILKGRVAPTTRRASSKRRRCSCDDDPNGRHGRRAQASDKGPMLGASTSRTPNKFGLQLDGILSLLLGVYPPGGVPSISNPDLHIRKCSYKHDLSFGITQRATRPYDVGLQPKGHRLYSIKESDL